MNNGTLESEQEGMGNEIKAVVEETAPYPVVNIQIILFDNGSLNINGFPAKLGFAIEVMQNATTAIINHFIKGAKGGKLDENNAFENNKTLAPIPTPTPSDTVLV